MDNLSSSLVNYLSFTIFYASMSQNATSSIGSLYFAGSLVILHFIFSGYSTFFISSIYVWSDGQFTTVITFPKLSNLCVYLIVGQSNFRSLLGWNELARHSLSIHRFYCLRDSKFWSSVIAASSNICFWDRYILFCLDSFLGLDLTGGLACLIVLLAFFTFVLMGFSLSSWTNLLRLRDSSFSSGSSSSLSSKSVSNESESWSWALSTLKSLFSDSESFSSLV